MTGADLIPLLQAVTEANGPITVRVGPDAAFLGWDTAEWLGGFCTAGQTIDTVAADHLVGALERDLTTRGVDFTCEYFQSVEDEPWAVQIGHIEDGPLIASAWGATKLEAYLHAWTDAAELNWGEAGS